MKINNADTIWFNNVLVDRIYYNNENIWPPVISVSPSPTPTITPSNTPSVTPSITLTPSRTPTPTPSITTSTTATPSKTPSITVTLTPSISTSPVVTPSVTPSVSPTITPSISVSLSITPTSTPSVSLTPSVTPSITPSITPTSTPSITPSITPTETPSITPTSTPTVSSTPSVTPSISASPDTTPPATPSTTPSVTPSISTTPSVTPSISITLTPTSTPSVTPTHTVTPSITISPTRSPTPTPTLTPTPSPAAPPSPSDPSLSIWYDATDTTTLIPNSNNGTDITQWNDKSAVAKNMVAVGGGTKPTVTTNYQNGQTMLYYNNTQTDATDASVGTALQSLSGVTLFFVAKSLLTGSAQQLVQGAVKTGNNYAAAGYELAISGSNQYTLNFAGGTAVSTTSDTNVHIHAIVFDGTQTGNANRLQHRLDGVAQTLTFTANVGTTTSATVDTIILGFNAAKTNYLSGYFGEVIFYNATLSAASIANTEAYLKNRWGIS